MQLEQLISKIRRLRAALGDARELDVSKFAPKIGEPSDTLVILQNFKGGLSKEQMENAAWTIVRAISDMHDHLRKWARANNRNPSEADEVIRGCEDLQLLMDLANFDKHGSHDRNGGWSGKRPALKEVNRVLQLQGGGGSFGLKLTATGPEVFGTSNAAVVITGDIVDSTGKLLRILPQAQAIAIEAWERLMDAWGLQTTEASMVSRGRGHDGS